MKKIIGITALSGALVLTASLCGCNTNPQDTASNGSGNGGSQSPTISEYASGNGGTSIHSSSSSPNISSESDDDLVSAVFWEDQKYY